MGAAASPPPHPCQGVQLSWGGWQILGGCDPRPGKAGLSQGLAELVFGVSVPAAGAVWGELMPGAGDRGRAGGSSPGAGEALPGRPRFGAERRRRRRMMGGMKEGRSQGVAQVMLLPAAVGARMGWEVCTPLEEIWGWSRTLNDG